MDAPDDSEAGAQEWLVVLRADGVVDSVDGGAPTTWLSRRLADVAGVPGILRRAAVDLELAPPSSNVRRSKVRYLLGRDWIAVEVLLVEALPLRRAHTRVHELVMRTLDLFASQATSNRLDLTIDRADDVPPSFIVDSEKVAWALSILVANALRYARNHVSVHLRCDASASLVIEVVDDGEGMPERKARWLFERDPATGQAAGLALLMVRDVMTAHRGSVSVESRQGTGTTFRLRFPRVRFSESSSNGSQLQ